MTRTRRSQIDLTLPAQTRREKCPALVPFNFMSRILCKEHIFIFYTHQIRFSPLYPRWRVLYITSYALLKSLEERGKQIARYCEDGKDQQQLQLHRILWGTIWRSVFSCAIKTKWLARQIHWNDTKVHNQLSTAHQKLYSKYQQVETSKGWNSFGSPSRFVWVPGLPPLRLHPRWRQRLKQQCQRQRHLRRHPRWPAPFRIETQMDSYGIHDHSWINADVISISQNVLLTACIYLPHQGRNLQRWLCWCSHILRGQCPWEHRKPAETGTCKLQMDFISNFVCVVSFPTCSQWTLIRVWNEIFSLYENKALLPF